METTTIGWREYVSLPDWHIKRIKAKADTGARTSAIDVVNIEELPNDRVRFEIVSSRSSGERRIPCEADIVRRTHVKSSLGRGHERIFVRTRLKIGRIEKEIEVSLVSRPNMLCRMLLGRKTLEPEFLVDSSRAYLISPKIIKRNPKRHAPALDSATTQEGSQQ